MKPAHPAKSSAFFEPSSSLSPFIAELNKRLVEQKLEILNDPSQLSDPRKLKAAQEEVRSQSDSMAPYGLLSGTTAGLVHVLPTAELDGYRALTQSEVHAYYSQHALLTMERKKCTCDGLCSTAFALAETLLKESSNTHMTVELCSLRNWCHALLRLSQSRADGSTESVFYDPWHQLCFSHTPAVPKIFLDEELCTEIETLRKYSPMIGHTEHLTKLKLEPGQKEFKLKAGMEEVNSQSDLAYFVACSNREFNNPAETRPDPSLPASSFSCVIS